MLQRETNLMARARTFINSEVKDEEEALKGARDIIAERVNEDERARNQVRNQFSRTAIITSKVVKGKEEEGQKFRDYFDFSEPLKRCTSHRLLALRRGEAEGILKVSISPDDEECRERLLRLYSPLQRPQGGREQRRSIANSMQAKLSSALLSEASLLHSCTPERLSYTPERPSYTPERLSCTPEESPYFRQHADVALANMRNMQPLCTQKVDWLSFYTVLLRRRWVEVNLSAFCRMVNDRFGVSLDNRTLSRDLKKNGPDYTLWIDDNNRISRRKRLAQEFDQHLTEYFKRGREEVMKGLRE